jgi:hypothetical protein
VKKIPNSILILLAVSAAGSSLLACGKRTETEKTTTIIERPVQQAPEAATEDGHLQRAGEKIDRKVDEKIDRAIDSMLK